MPHIDRIELRGFKSFGTTKVTVPLARGLTAIVGRNGHGKSNIADALCFVFGESSRKFMRADNYTDLIYARDHKPIAQFAEVSLHIDNHDGGLPLDSDLVSISRRVKRDGKCDYRINGKRASLQEIVDLLSPVMGTTDSYNFVMQGEVKKIVDKNPVELRQVIDGLAGVSEYEEKKEKAQSQLQQANEKLGILNAKLEVIAGDVEKYRQQAHVLERHRKLETELEQVKGAKLQKEILEREGRQKGMDKLIASMESRVRVMEKRYREMVARAESLGDEAEKIQKLIDGKRGSEVMVRAGSLRSEQSAINGLIRSAIRDKERVANEIEEAKRSAVKSGKGTLADVKRFKDLHHNLENLSRSFEEAKSLEEAKKSITEIRATLDEISSLMDSLVTAFSKGKVSGAEARQLRDFTKLEVSSQLYEGQIKELSSKLERAKKKLEKISSEEKKLKTSIDSLEKKKSALMTKAKGLRAKAATIHDKVIPLSDRAKRKGEEKVEIDTELKAFRKDLATAKADFTQFMDLGISELDSKSDSIQAELSSIGDINKRALRDMREAESRHSDEKQKYDCLLADQQAILEFMSEMDEKKKNVFMKTFTDISRHFTEIFRELSKTGTGQLKLHNEENPFEGGLEIDADFGEGLNRRLLSGGQKTLTAVAFIFALQMHRPTTFYVMDEIDESLDPANRQRIAELLEKYSKESQMVVITLYDTIASVADRVFGVQRDKETKISKVLSVDFAGLGD